MFAYIFLSCVDYIYTFFVLNLSLDSVVSYNLIVMVYIVVGAVTLLVNSTCTVVTISSSVTKITVALLFTVITALAVLANS